MKLDFLLFYEQASRELESDCYLAALLKQRGYRVKVINRRYLWRVFLNPKVIITPYLYGDKDVHEFTGFICGRKRAIVDLQYEQIYNKARLESAFSRPSALSSLATHICWGNNTRKRMLGFCVSEDNLPVTGAISMDFNRPQLRLLLKTKEELSTEFDLDISKEWHLFISSFVYSSLSKSSIQVIEEKIPGYGPFVEVTCESQKIVVEWIINMAKKHPEQEFIYRPHPNEFDTPLVNNLKIASSNIRVISSYSIRQWVAVCDTCSNWFSTSIADCYFSKRPCCVLRPVTVPERFEIKILEGCKVISTLEDFDAFLSNQNPEACPLNMDVFSSLYLTDTSILFGERVADVCERVYNGNVFPFGREWKDCFRSFKYDVLASIFRLFPQLGGKSNSRFFDFHRMAMSTRNDRLLLHQYMKKIESFLSNGK